MVDLPHMFKPRLLIPVTLQFGIRYLLRSGLLEKLKNVITPVILIDWQDEGLWKEFKNAGAEVYLLPKAEYGGGYLSARKVVDIYHKIRAKSVTTTIDRRRQEVNWGLKKRFGEVIKRGLINLRLFFPGYVQALFKLERNLIEADTNILVFKNILAEINPDAVFSLTPFHQQEQLLLRAAKSMKLPMSTAIHSFDNLTTRGWIPVIFDMYYLWNQYNRSELLRIYPEAKQSQIVLTGTPQFDFYYDPSYLWSQKKWRESLGLPADRRVILFAAGPESIAPHEALFLGQIDNAIESGEILGSPVVLFRRHPVDSMKRWEDLMQSTRHVYYDGAWQSHDPMHFNIYRNDLEKLASSLYYCDVHVSTSSTMTIDGAIFNRPQIGLAYDDRPGRRYDRACKELYQREHYMPITASGCLDIVNSREELIGAINRAFSDPNEKVEQRKDVVKQICTFPDGKCADRVAAELSNFVANLVVKK